MSLIAPLCAHAEAAFHIECPPDVTVDCDAEVWDLSIYGWAYVHGYGNPVPADDPYVHYNLNSCGTGYITRTWTAYDYQNNPHSCTQFIYVGGGAFNEYNIQWPPNYETDDCNAILHPDNVPAPYDYPTYDDLDCSNIMIGYEDLVFDFGGGCKKILRTWSILDWCSYNPSNPYGGGRWDHVQVLKVKPDGGLMLDCPDDIIASAGANCSGTYVDIPVVTGTGACGSSVQVQNNSPYAQSNGANASGYYPFGTTTIKFTAEDACGNWESCYVTVTIKDMKKPTPICYNGLTANLMMQADGYYIDLDAEWFNKGSFDNCTPEHQLRYRIEPERFTCDDLGEQDVKMYVIDLDGNEQYCNTYVIIQDNMGMCPPADTTTFTLSGSIVSPDGSPMVNMDVELASGNAMVDEIVSGTNGDYQFNDVMNSEDYAIQPIGNDDYTLGLSTFDLLQLARHVNAIESFDSNAELIAADANQDGQVDPQDILTLQRLLLNYTTSLPNDRAWRFVKGNVDEIDLANATDDMGTWTMNDLQDNYADIDFTAIKIGDVNGSIQGYDAAQSRTNPTMTFIMERKGDMIHFVADRMIETNGMQLALSCNSDVTLTSDVLQISAANQRMDNGKLLVSWYTISDAVKIEQGDIVFSVQSDATETLDRMALAIESMNPEIYSTSDVIYELSLKRDGKEEAAIVGLKDQLQIFPNPSAEDQQINVITSDVAEAIRVFDIAGRMVFEQRNLRTAEIIIPAQVLGEGLFLTEVMLPNGTTIIERMIIKKQ